MKRVLIFLILVSLFYSCAGNRFVDLSGKLYEFDDTKQDYGYILGFLGATTESHSRGTALQSFIYFYYDIDETKKSWLRVRSDTSEPYDIEETDLVGREFFAKVPTGEYSLNHVTFFGLSNGKSIRTGSDKPLGIKVKVEKNVVTYVGSFVTVGFVSKSLLNVKYPSGSGFFRHSYELERDKQAVFKKYPDIEKENLLFKQLNHKFFYPPLIFPAKTDK